MGDSKDHPTKNPVDSLSPATSSELPNLSTSPNPPETLNKTQNSPPALQGVSIQSSAASRLHQLSSHLSSPNPPESLIQDAAPNQTPNTKRTRRRSKSTSRSSSSDLPADYSDILTNLAIMKKMNNTPDPTNRGYVRQKLAGKLWARERIEKLLNKDSWREIGSVSGTATWTVDAKNPQSEHVEGFTPSNNPQGFGSVTCLRTGQKR